MTRTAVVTGSSGFVGRHLVAELARRGWEVTEVDVVTGDDARAFFRLSSRRFDLVVHCAAVVGGRMMIDGDPLTLAVEDLTLDAELYRFAARTRPGRVVYFSSSAAYPVAFQAAHLARPLDEDLIDHTRQWIGAPDQTYGLVKLVGERLALEARAAGVDVTVFRPFSGYGADQDRAYPFPTFIDRAAGREAPFDVWGDGEQVRDFVHIDDIVRAVLVAVELGVDGPVNIGTGRPVSFNELAGMCMRAAGYDAELRHHLDRPTGVEYRVADPRRLHEFYLPAIELEEGIDRAFHHLNARSTRQ